MPYMAEFMGEIPLSKKGPLPKQPGFALSPNNILRMKVGPKKRKPAENQRVTVVLGTSEFRFLE